MFKRFFSFGLYATKELLFKKQQKPQKTLKHLSKALQWVNNAQISQNDGGVSAYYTITRAWGSSFIETTGYLIGSLIKSASFFPELNLILQAEKMANFLLEMQLKNGGFRTYPPSHTKKSNPTIFNTAQDVIGLTDIYHATQNKKYLKAAQKGADFLLKEQKKDGTWHYKNKPYSYHSRVALALAKVWYFTKSKKYKLAAEKNIQWTLLNQQKNGWFSENTLYDFPSKHPITHTIAYTLEGIFFTGIILKKSSYIKKALFSIDVLKNIIDKNGNIFATYDENWNPKSKYQCLTGNAQIAELLFHAYFYTKEKSYKKTGIKVVQRLKELQALSSFDKGVEGGVAGSSPLMGDFSSLTGYCRGAFLNWSVKFFIDSLISELKIQKKQKTEEVYVYS